ncbi:MAG: TfoX/Sxy family protein [Betaproteobacteria bacterium]
MAASRDFVDYCCELLSSVGPCVAKRMFGGWGLSLDGLTFAIIANLDGGEKLWLKADADSTAQFEAIQCQRFSYSGQKNGKPVNMSMAYYSAPIDAMESALAMAPWARLALGSALAAQQLKASRKPAVRRPRTHTKPPGA